MNRMSDRNWSYKNIGMEKNGATTKNDVQKLHQFRIFDIIRGKYSIYCIWVDNGAMSAKL